MNNKRNFLQKLLVAVIAVSMIFSCFSTSAFAATKKTTKKNYNVFKDVTKKTDYYKDIEWVFAKKGWEGIAKKGGNLKPYYVMTEGEFNKMLTNMYGSRISLKKAGSAKLTQKYATKTLTNVSKQLGYPVTWQGGSASAKVTRSKAAHYVKQMVNISGGRLNP